MTGRCLYGSLQLNDDYAQSAWFAAVETCENKFHRLQACKDIFAANETARKWLDTAKSINHQSLCPYHREPEAASIPASKPIMPNYPPGTK